jgi:hypothetical protein
VQEIHFLHERGRKLAWFIFIQNVSNCVFFITSTYMTSAWGWRWWYGFFTIFSGVILAFSYVFVSETEFDRPSDASTGQVHLDFNDKGELEDGGNVHKLVQVTTRHGTVLEPERYGARTWKRDLRLINIKPRWHLVLPHYKHIAQGLCIPTIFWLLIVNGAWLGMYVFTAGTFATILVPPPYGFAFNSLGYVQAGQIVCFMIFLPLAGYGSDWLIKRLSMRNDGVFKPEYRLIGLALPAVVGVISAVVYGQAAQRPAEWHWSAIVVPYNAVNFAFNCVNLVGITYAVESFPQRAASLLVVICAGRGIISFGLDTACDQRYRLRWRSEHPGWYWWRSDCDGHRCLVCGATHQGHGCKVVQHGRGGLRDRLILAIRTACANLLSAVASEHCGVRRAWSGTISHR